MMVISSYVMFKTTLYDINMMYLLIAFGGDKVEDLSRILIEHHHHYLGKEYLTSGITGLENVFVNFSECSIIVIITLWHTYEPHTSKL